MKNRVPHTTPVQRFFRQVRRNRFWLLTYLWLALAVPELVLHCCTSPDLSSLFSTGLILGPLFALIPGMVLFFLCTAIPKPGLNYGIALGYSGLAFLLWGSQAVYYSQNGRFYALSSLVDPAIPDLLSALADGFSGVWGILLGMAFPFLVLLFLGKALFSFRAIKNRRSHGILLLFCLCLHLLLVLALPLFGGAGDLSAYGLYHNSGDRYYSVNRLGLLTTLRLEVQRLGSDTEGSDAILLETLPPEASTVPSLPLSTPATPVIVTGENRLDLDLALLAQKTENTSVAEIHRYFAGKTSTAKNEKTGLFRGSNLILITADAFRQSEVTPETTPTLHRMMTQGFAFRDYYIPDWVLSPEEGEYALLTGLIPTDGSIRGSAVCRMPLTLAQQLIPEGYSVWSFDRSSSPDRAAFLENLGLQALHYGNRCNSDAELVDLSTKNYINDRSFLAYYHFSGQDMEELETAAELLLARLDAAGALEHTAILLTSTAGECPGTGPQSCRNGCILWKRGMESAEISGPSSILDLLPTLSNLFGLDFDSRLYIGMDLFSNGQPLVLFRDRSWMTDRCIYNAVTGKITNQTGDGISNDYVNQITIEVHNRFAISAAIPQWDYWKTLFP